MLLPTTQNGLSYFFGKYEGWDPHNALRQLQFKVLGYLGTKYMYLPLQYFQIYMYTLEVFECMCICCLDVDCMMHSW